MGYTHYWTFKGTRSDLKTFRRNYALAEKQCHKVIQFYSKEFGGLAGYSAHTSLKEYGGITFNGSERTGACENFSMPDISSMSDKDLISLLKDTFNFCKTRQYPYDSVVVACLIIFKHYLKDNLGVSSDGRDVDWQDGLILAKAVTSLKSLSIPLGVQVSREEAV